MSRLSDGIAGADNGGIVTGWLLKLTLGLLILGITGFDAIAIGSAKVTASDTAQDAAMAASTNWQQNHDAMLAYQAAEEVAEQQHATVLTRGFLIDTPSGTTHLIVRKDARTVVVAHIGPLKRWQVQQSSGVATSTS